MVSVGAAVVVGTAASITEGEAGGWAMVRGVVGVWWWGRGFVVGRWRAVVGWWAVFGGSGARFGIVGVGEGVVGGGGVEGGDEVPEGVLLVEVADVCHVGDVVCNVCRVTRDMCCRVPKMKMFAMKEREWESFQATLYATRELQAGIAYVDLQTRKRKQPSNQKRHF